MSIREDGKEFLNPPQSGKWGGGGCRWEGRGGYYLNDQVSRQREGKYVGTCDILMGKMYRQYRCSLI